MSEADWDFDPTIELQPIDARFAPAKSGSKTVVYIAVAGGVLLSAVTILTIAWKIASLGSSKGLSATVTAHRTPAELRAESVAAFTNYDAAAERLKQRTPEETQEREAILQLFSDLEKSAKADDSDQFRNLVDFERLLSRVDQTGGMRGWSNFNKRAVKNEMRSSAAVESSWHKIVVVSILPTADDSNSRVVYALAWDGPHGQQSEYRFWIARSGQSWKLYDWTRLDLTMSQSEEWGAYARNATTPQMANFRRWSELVDEVDGLIASNSRPAAIDKLRLAESKRVPKELQNYQYLYTAHRWMELGEYAEAERCYRSVSDPVNAPGAYYGIMQCLRDRQPVEALKYAELYEETVGPNPDLSEIKASLLEGLGRNEEALIAWNQLLLADPDNNSALIAVLKSLPKDDQSGLDSYLDLTEDPVKVVVDLAPSAAYHDSQRVKYLADFLHRKAPAAAGTSYVAGLVKTLDGRYGEAAARYRRAFEAEKDEEKRRRYANNYMEAMIADGHLLDIWTTLPNPKEAFDYLFTAYDEGEIELTDDEYRQVIDLYRRQFPDELDAIDRKATFMLNQEKFGEAETLLRRGLRLARSKEGGVESESHRDTFSRSLATALYRQGKVKEAYESMSGQEEGFSTLSQLAVSEERWNDVRTLIDLERAKDPDGGKLHDAESELAAHEERWDDALRHFDERVKSAGPTEQWLHKRRRQELYVESGRWMELYTTAEDRGEAFDNLASRFVLEANWDAFDSLVAAHRSHAPGDIRLARQVADAAWAREDYPTYIEQAQQVLAKNDANAVAPYIRDRLEEQLLSALVRTKQFDRAMQLAHVKHRDHNTATYLAIVTAANGDWSAADRWAREVAMKEESAAVLYADDDVGHLFAGEQFAELQKNFPVETRYDAAPTLAVFFLEQPFKLDAKDVADAAKEAGVEQPLRVEPIKSTRTDITSAFAIRVGEAAVWIAAGDGKYFERPRLRGENAETRESFNNGKAWLAVGVASWRAADRKQAENVARRITVQLAKGRAVAFLALGKEAWRDDYLYPASDELLATWRSAADLKAFKNRAVSLTESAYDSSIDRDFDRRFQEAVRTFESTPGTRLEVVECVPGEKLDPLRLNVTSVRRFYGRLEFDGVLMNSSRLIPQLREGLPMRFSSYAIEAWRLNDEGPMYRRGDRKVESASQ